MTTQTLQLRIPLKFSSQRLINMADFITFLPLLSLVCGIVNVLVVKWCDSLKAEDVTGLKRSFQHPFLQTTLMFMGQIICLVVYKIAYLVLARRRDGSEFGLIVSGSRLFSPYIFILPAFCDVIASTMLLTSLYITNASSWQMIRGVSLIFVSLFSVNYLYQDLKIHHWLGMLITIIGLIIVIVFDIHNFNNYDSKAILAADLLIICSQIFQAIQYVYEEKYIKILDIDPMQAVGWQGVFGLIQSLLLLIPFSFIKIDQPFNNNSNGSMEYLPDAFHQLFKNPVLIVAHIIFLISVVVYNYSRVTVMKNTSSRNYIVMDTFRAIPIYIISILVQREVLSVTVIIAFVVLLSGSFTYNNVVFTQVYIWFLRKLTRRRYDDMDAQVNVINSAADGTEA